MSTMMQILIYTIDGQFYGLPVLAVQRVTFAAEITHIPNAPTTILGMLNMQGDVIPVVNMRMKCQIVERPIRISDRFIIIKVKQHLLALLVDDVREIIDFSPDEIMQAGVHTIADVVKSGDDLVLIHQLDKFFDVECEASICELVHHDNKI
jgi:purine-binding chemotaxis protein CheW